MASVEFIRHVLQKWRKDSATRMAAALAYYTVFSTAAFLVLLVAAFTIGLGSIVSKDELLAAAQTRFGLFGAFGAQALLADISNRSETIVASSISLIVLLFGATRVFTQLQHALDTIWEARSRHGTNLVAILRKRLLAFLSILVAGLLLLISVGIKTARTIGAAILGDAVADWDSLWRISDIVVSYALLLFVFALVFRVMPSVTIAWSDVWLGAAVTTILFWIGRYLFGVYVAHSVFTSVYGTAGTFFVILIWYYFVSLIMLLGAECTYVYAIRHGSHVRLAEALRSAIKETDQ